MPVRLYEVATVSDDVTGVGASVSAVRAGTAVANAAVADTAVIGTAVTAARGAESYAAGLQAAGLQALLSLARPDLSRPVTTRPHPGRDETAGSGLTGTEVAAPDTGRPLPAVETLRTPPRRLGGRRPGRQRRRLRAGVAGGRGIPLPLLGILVIQAALAASLMHANSAFQDEALYLWAGHLELAHLLHGAPIPLFPTFFSGAPVLYPPLAALADSIGGLTAARLLSTGFMLAATLLLWGTTARLYGRRAAFFAAAVWAVLGPTLHLSAFATFDAMSLFLVTLAAWLATGARNREDSTGWILAATAVLALANAVKYASALFDPAVIAMACLCAFPRPGGKIAIRRAALMLTCLTGLIAVLVKLAGLYYSIGIRQTTLTRTQNGNTVTQVLTESRDWAGIVIILAVAGAVLGMLRQRSRGQQLLLLVLAGTGLLVPLEQARIHTTTSLDKHIAFGAWFAMIAGGYAIDMLLTVITPRVRGPAAAAAAIALLVPAGLGLGQARTLFSWPDTSAFIAGLRPYVDATSGPVLVETPSVAEYYLPAGRQWQRWSSTWTIRMRDTKTTGSQGVGKPGDWPTFQKYIRWHYFAVVALNMNATRGLDRQIVSELRIVPGYVLVKQLPYGNIGQYQIWVYRPPPRSPATPIPAVTR